MLSFKQFLNESDNVLRSWATEDKTLSEIIGVLNTHCKDGLKAVANGGILYRGDKRITECKVIDSSKSHRMSRDTNNMYQLMMDASENLKDFPSRSKSIICATTIDTASMFSGDVSVLIPFDGTQIAYSKKFCDLFFTKPETPIVKLSLEDIGSAISGVLNTLEVLPNITDKLQSHEYLDKQLTYINPIKIVDEMGKDFLGKDFDGTLLLKILSRCPDNKKFTALSSALLTPTSMFLDTKPFGGVLPTDGHGNSLGNEAWFSGKCVAIPESFFTEIVKEMLRKDMSVHPSIIRWTGRP